MLDPSATSALLTCVPEADVRPFLCDSKFPYFGYSDATGPLWCSCPFRPSVRRGWVTFDSGIQDAASLWPACLAHQPAERSMPSSHLFQRAAEAWMPQRAFFLHEKVRCSARFRAAIYSREKAASTAEDNTDDVVRRTMEVVANSESQCRWLLARVPVMFV